MPSDPSPASTLVPPGPPPRPDAGARPSSTAPARRGRRRLWVAVSLIGSGLLAAFAWSESHPTALAEAEAAYRRNELAVAFRLAEGHLARRPFSRHAALLAARCLSRLARPDQAEPYYQK